jgi:hypothetical protein
MNQSTGLEHACCARLPASALAVLADLRREPGIGVIDAGESAWVRWEAGNEAVLRRLLPVAGVEFYARRKTEAGVFWYRPGAHLPTFGIPAGLEDESIPLARALTPRPIEARGPDGGPPSPVVLGLARESRAREATALRCALADLGRWADRAATAELAALSAAWADDVVLLLGRRLPPIAGARFWGDRLLSPLGFRPEPALPEPALRRALGAAAGEVVVLEADGFERIPRDAFRPLTRAGVRLAPGPAEAPAPAPGGPPP